VLFVSAVTWARMRTLVLYALHMLFNLLSFPVPVISMSVGSWPEQSTVNMSDQGATCSHSLLSSCVQVVWLISAILWEQLVGTGVIGWRASRPHNPHLNVSPVCDVFVYIRDGSCQSVCIL
jgi:hypothetical protein